MIKLFLIISLGALVLSGCFHDEEANVIVLGDMYRNTSMRSAASDDQRFYVYMDFPNVVLFDSEHENEKDLMSVFDTTAGVDFFWSPDNRIIAMTVVNQQEESYTETLGTKLFLLTIDEEGELVDKEAVSLRIRYECHDAGCNVSNADFYWENVETIVYRTWESDTPYEDAGDDSLLQKLQLNNSI